jgi:hypothetical protein
MYDAFEHDEAPNSRLITGNELFGFDLQIVV